MEGDDPVRKEKQRARAHHLGQQRYPYINAYIERNCSGLRTNEHVDRYKSQVCGVSKSWTIALHGVVVIID